MSDESRPGRADGAAAAATNPPDATSAVLRTYGVRPSCPGDRLFLPPAAAHRPLRREQELSQLVTALRQRLAVALRGEQGVGKTGLAAEAVEVLHEEGLFKDGIVWVESVCEATAEALCDAIAAHLGNIEIPRLNPSKKLGALYQLLDGRDMLIVLNFVRSPETAYALSQNCPDDTALLVISAAPLEFDGFDVRISLDNATADDAAEFFSRRMVNRDTIREICTMLDNNPLALLYASGYVRYHADPRVYDLCRDLGSRIAELREAGDEDEHLQTRAAFGVTVRVLGPFSGRLLALLAASFDRSVGIEMLSIASGYEAPDCAALLRELARLSLVELEVKGRYTMHPLSRSLMWQEWQVESQEACEGRLLEAALRYTAQYGEDGARDYEKLEAELGNLLGAARKAYRNERWGEVLRLVTGLVGVLQERNHWAELLEMGRLGVAAAEKTQDAVSCANLLREMAATLMKQGDYAEAHRLLTQCAEISRGTDDPEQKAETLHLLGQLAQVEGDTSRAEEYFRGSLDIYEQLGSQGGVAANLYQFGRIAHERLDFKEAQRLYEEALKIKKSLGKGYELEVAETLNGLALVHEKTGNYSKAEQLYKRALEIYRRSGQQAALAASTHNLAGLYFAMGHYRKAERNYQKAHDLRKCLLGARHPDVAQSLNNLAAVHYAMGNYTAAAPLWQQALDIYRAAFGEQHPYYAAVLGNLAGLYYAAGNYEAAEPLYEQALRIRRETLGDRHLGVAQILSNVALLYGATGRHEEAVQFMKEAAEINLQILGDSHPGYADSLTNLGILYKGQGLYEDAEKYLTRALEIKRSAYRENHPAVAQAINELARLYEEAHNYPQAISYMSEAVKVFRAALKDDHPYVAQGLISLGLLYELTGRFDEAAPLYRQAAEIYGRALGEDHTEYVNALNYLAALYVTTGKWDEARAAYHKILRVHRQSQREDEQVALTLYGLGHVAQVLREYDEALSYFNEALGIKRKLVDKSGEAKALARIGFIKCQQGLHEEAAAIYQRGLEVSESLGKEGSVAQFLHLFGILRMEQQRLEEARGYFMRSLEISKRLGAHSQAKETLLLLAELARRQGSEEDEGRFKAEAEKISAHLSKVEDVRNNISKPHDENHVRTLSNELGVDYEDLPGRGEGVKLQELAATVYRQI